MSDLTPLARLLGIVPAPGRGTRTLRMPLGPESRNSYGKPSGGALATLAAEAATAADGEGGITRLQVRYLAAADDGVVDASAVEVGDDVEVTLSHEERIVAFASAAIGVLPSLTAGLAAAPRGEPIRRWDEVPQLSALDLAELAPDRPGTLLFELPLWGAALDAHGRPHAGALLTLVDLAGGQWALRSPGAGGVVVTLDAEVRWVAPATSSLFRARASGLRAGRQVVTAGVTITDAGDTLVARGSVAMLRVG